MHRALTEPDQHGIDKFTISPIVRCSRADADAHSEAALDLAELCSDKEDDASDVCRELLRQVHPDKVGNRSFSSGEVSQMLNAVRDSLRNSDQ